jgi:phospholipid/cholesterol/gamma-HCH transport system substrate-binding protein
MENKAHALAAGIFVLLVGALTVALASWLHADTRERFLYEVSTRYALNGLQPQAAVRYRGITVGKVTEMGFDPKVRGNVLVRLALENNSPITRATYATLGQQGVTGIAFVQLEDDEKGSLEPLPTDARNPARLPYRQDFLGKLADQGEAILGQVQQTTQRINQVFGPDNQKSLASALDGIGKAAGGVERLAGTLDATVNTRVNPALAAVPATLGEANKAMQTLQATTQDFSKVAGEVGQAVQKVTEKGGLLDALQDGSTAATATLNTVNSATLPRVHRVVEDAARTVRSVNRVSASLGDNPQALIFGNGTTLPGPGEPGFAAPSVR